MIVIWGDATCLPMVRGSLSPLEMVHGWVRGRRVSFGCPDCCPGYLQWSWAELWYLFYVSACCLVVISWGVNVLRCRVTA